MQVLGKSIPKYVIEPGQKAFLQLAFTIEGRVSLAFKFWQPNLADRNEQIVEFSYITKR